MHAESELLRSGWGGGILKVFVVEDNDRLRKLISVYLGMNEGIELCGRAASGEDAMDAIRRDVPDVVLVDLSLPGISGIELIEAIRREYPGTHCLVLSAHREPEYARKALEAGACGYVLKGQPEEVAEALEAVRRNDVFVSSEIQSVL